MAMLYSREGVTVALTGAEVWSAGVIVRLAGLPNDETEALASNHQENLAAWARRGREAAEVTRHPGEDVFDVDLAVSDDSGTSYTPRTISKGGSGQLLRAEWFFEPGPPESSSRVAVRVSREGREIELVDLSSRSRSRDILDAGPRQPPEPRSDPCQVILGTLYVCG
jgi:hypothetical protein